MPAIHLFGRRWNVGSDDFVFPGIIEIVTRTAWMIVLLIVYILEVDELGRCQNGSKLKAFYVGIILLLMAYFILNISMVTLSARGYIMEPLPRRHVATLLYLKLALFLPEISWAVVGTLWTFQLEHDCRKLPVGLGKAIVVVEWIIIVLVLLSLYLMFDPLGKRHVKKRSLKDYNQMWHDRCRFLCCCILQDENRREAFEEITDLLSNFFRGRDYVLSDVFAGVVLLSIKQKYQERQEKNFTLSEAPTLPIRSPRTRDSSLPGAIPLTRQLGHVDTQTSYNEPTGQPIGLGDSERGHLNQAFVSDSEDGRSERYWDKQILKENTKLFGSKSVKSYGSSDVSSLDTATISFPTEYTAKASQESGEVKLRKQLPKSPSIASSSSSYSDSAFYPMAPPIGPKKWMTLENCAYYLRIATAIYGSSNYSGCYNCSDRIPLCKKYRWRSSDQHLPSTVVHGDNWWECEVSSIMLYAGFSRDEIIYASLDNQIFKIPYFIARDDAKKAVVIAIRGTMSAGDALTDLAAQGVDIRDDNMPRGNVHSGVLKVARHMVKQLREHVRLQDKVPRGYSLVVTGHSLGAGVAAILSLLLRSDYPDVTCFAFSPPGGLVSQMLSVFMQEFVLVLFLGMDVVPRLSVITMEKLKSDLMVVMKNSRIPKYKILSSGIGAMCCGWSNSRLTDLLVEDTLTQRLSDSVYQEIYRDAHDTQSMSGSSLGDTDSIYQDFVPGANSSRASFSSSVTDTESEVTDYEWPEEGHDRVSRTYSSESGSIHSGPSRSSSVSTSRTWDHSKNRTASRTPSGRPLSASHAKWRSKQKKVKKGLAASEPLLLPGFIMYLYQDDDLSTTGCCTSDDVYKYRWARAEEFDQVILDSRMMNHHNPYSIRDALEQILEQEGFTGISYGEKVVATEPSRSVGNTFAKPNFLDTDIDIATEIGECIDQSQLSDIHSLNTQEAMNYQPGDLYVVDIPTDAIPEEPQESMVVEFSETKPTMELEHFHTDDTKPAESPREGIQTNHNTDSTRLESTPELYQLSLTEQISQRHHKAQANPDATGSFTQHDDDQSSYVHGYGETMLDLTEREIMSKNDKEGYASSSESSDSDDTTVDSSGDMSGDENYNTGQYQQIATGTIVSTDEKDMSSLKDITKSALADSDNDEKTIDVSAKSCTNHQDEQFSVSDEVISQQRSASDDDTKDMTHNGKLEEGYQEICGIEDETREESEKASKPLAHTDLETENTHKERVDNQLVSESRPILNFSDSTVEPVARLPKQFPSIEPVTDPKPHEYRGIDGHDDDEVEAVGTPDKHDEMLLQLDDTTSMNKVDCDDEPAEDDMVHLVSDGDDDSDEFTPGITV